MFRSALIGVAAALALAQIASAADMATKSPVQPVPVTAYNWTGIYAGGSVGGAWATEGPFAFPFFGTQATTPNANSWMGSGFLGAQWQWNNIVLGVEGNVIATRLDHVGQCPNPAAFCELKTTESITVGPRLGWAFNNWLLYGTGGYARTTLKTFVIAKTTGAITDSSDASHPGWFAGAGVEYALLPNVIVGLEYSHIQANVETDAAPPINPIDDRSVGTKIDSVRGRLSVKFNPW